MPFYDIWFTGVFVKGNNLDAIWKGKIWNVIINERMPNKCVKKEKIIILTSIFKGEGSHPSGWVNGRPQVLKGVLPP